MGDENITSLFGSASTPTNDPIAAAIRKPDGRSAPPAAADAVGSALLAGMLAELALLKAAVLGQGQVNANVEQWVRDAGAAITSQNAALQALNVHLDTALAAQRQLIESLGARVDGLGRIIGELDSRLYRLDGRRSVPAVPKAVGADTPPAA